MRRRKWVRAVLILLAALAAALAAIALLIPPRLLALKGDTCRSLEDVYTDMGHAVALVENGRWDGRKSLEALFRYVFSDRYDELFYEWRMLEEKELPVPEGMRLTERTVYLVPAEPSEKTAEGTAFYGDRVGLRLFYERYGEELEDWEYFDVRVFGSYLCYPAADGTEEVGYTSALILRTNPVEDWVEKRKESSFYGELREKGDGEGNLTPEGQALLEARLSREEWLFDSAVLQAEKGKIEWREIAR